MSRHLVFALAMWACAAAVILLLLLWATGIEFEIDLGTQYTIGIRQTALRFDRWSVPRAVQERDPDHAIGPDTLNIPLWFLTLFAGGCAAIFWRLDRPRRLALRAARRAAADRAPRCPTCHRTLA